MDAGTFLGVDIGKSGHYAIAVDADREVFDVPLAMAFRLQFYFRLALSRHVGHLRSRFHRDLHGLIHVLGFVADWPLAAVQSLP